MPQNFWLIIGKPENWDIALKDEIWGLIPKFGGKWKYLQPGDLVFFYVTNPISGIIGLGKVQAKFKQDKPLWPDEISQGTVLYPYRFEFTSEYVLPQDKWKSHRIKTHLPTGMYSGINIIGDQDLIDDIQKEVNQQWNITIDNTSAEISNHSKPVKEDISLKTPDLSHNKVRDMVFEIGKLQRYITEKEYAMNGERLDVVWRRVEKSVPTYAFEIQVGGDIYHALGKLKHAYDIWNSNIYLVTDEQYREQIAELLSGTFHEIKNYIKVITLQQINYLYNIQNEDMKFRKEIGLT